jgi:hypothetical protein
MAGKRVKAPGKLDGIMDKMKKNIGKIFSDNPGAKVGKRVGKGAADTLLGGKYLPSRRKGK